MRPRRATLLILAALAVPTLPGCHMMEGLSYDIEDASAYTGERIATGGERLAGWVRELQDN